MPNGKTGVLIHGLNLETEGWKDIVWGTPPDLVGRLPRGVAVAVAQRADVIVLGSGGSDIDGKLEAEYTRDFLLKNFSELAQFSLFQGINVQNIQPRIEMILQPETRSRNTYEEIKYAAEVFMTAEVTTIVLVSSPTHLPRCLRDACIVFGQDARLTPLAQNLYVSPSQTSFHGTTASDVAIVEPPHQPNRSGLSKTNLVNRMLKVSDLDDEAFLEDLQDILAKYSV